jgi:DNA polymerase I-like protein with 3'-5' exonuclease and polymerase domains/uracil-DNA glycosylase
MTFFFEAEKRAAKPASSRPQARKEMPVTTLQQLGCGACPLDKREGLQTPKMKPTGERVRGGLYVLQERTEFEDDDTGEHMRGKLTDEVFRKLGRRLTSEARFNALTQCFTAGEVPVQSIECCRKRIEADILASEPLIVVGVGDECLRWATGLTNGAITWRGSLIACWLNGFTFWYFPLAQPNYVFAKNKWGKSEYELALEHDCATIDELLNSDLRRPAIPDPTQLETGIEIITGNDAGDMDRLEAALAKLLTEPDVGIDIETNALRPWGKDPRIWTCAIGTEKHTVAFPVDHPDGWPTPRLRTRCWSMLADFLLNCGRLVPHELGMEMSWLAFFFGQGFLRRAEWEDTLLAAHTFDERQGTKGLGVQTRLHFGFNVKDLSNIDTKRIVEYPIKKTLLYNALDTKWTSALWRRVYKPKLARDATMRAEYERKVNLAPTLVLTEHQGVPADLAYAEAQSKAFQLRAKELQAQLPRCPEVKAYERRFGTFNPGAPEQVVRLLHEICKRPEVTVVERGITKRTSGEDALVTIPAREVPSVPIILELRTIEKLDGTYLTPMIQGRMTGMDRLIHTKYSSTIAVTGRLAAEDPNLQNFPKRKHKEVRGFVAAPAGSKLMPCDYGQIEFRVVGMASEDPALIEACWTGYDVHKFWAQRILALYPEALDWLVEEFGIDGGDDALVLKTMRQEAKNKWVFPQLFGASTRSCAANLHLPDDVTEELGGEFWDTFKVTKEWQDRLVQRYDKTLYVETLGGRRRRGPMSRNEVINAPIQGTACDIVTKAMDALSELAYIEERPTLHPIINVHDDLTFLPYDHTMLADIDTIALEMCRHRFDWIIVPLVVEVSTGQRWHECKEIGVFKSHELFNMRNPYA